MIFNKSSGAVSFLRVTAPSTATITATYRGTSFTGTGTCIIYLPIMGTWSVTCSYGGSSKTVTTTVSAFGVNYDLFFGAIDVTAPDSASITASMSGQADVIGTGTCSLIVTAPGTWTVTSVCQGEQSSDTAVISASALVATVTFILPLPTYTYSGDCELVSDGSGDWKLRFLTSGTLIFTYVPAALIDVFLVGGGGGGGASAYSGGGGGGYTLTQRSVSITADTSYAITIGDGGVSATVYANGGRGGTTSAFGYSVDGGYGGGSTDRASNSGGGGDGGSGGSEGYDSLCHGGSDGSDGDFRTDRYRFYPVTRQGLGQGTTTREFGEPAGDLYAGGGGGNLGLGGDGGGGNGGASVSYSNGDDGTPNTGGGGGGGSGSSGYHSGAGGSGIVVIRNSR